MKLCRKLLMISLVAIFAFSGVMTAGAQSLKKERRIYLWDVTISMVGAPAQPKFVGCEPPKDRANPSYKYNEEFPWYNEEGDIFEETRARLVESIRSISSQDCEIVVIPYTNKLYSAMEVLTSTEADKDALIERVMEWDNLKSAGTYTGKCLQDVIDNFFKENKANRVILLTDGNPSDDDPGDLMKIIREWDTNGTSRTKETEYKDNRLVYVMLNETAQNAELESLIHKKNAEKDSGVDVLNNLKDLENYVSFSLGRPDEQEHIIEADEFPDGFSLSIGYALSMSMGQDDTIRCIFSTDDPYVSIDSSEIVEGKDGKFVVPVTYRYDCREDYLIMMGKAGHEVTVKCEVDSSCSNVKIEGQNMVKFDLCVLAQPKAVISISTK